VLGYLKQVRHRPLMVQIVAHRDLFGELPQIVNRLRASHVGRRYPGVDGVSRRRAHNVATTVRRFRAYLTIGMRLDAFGSEWSHHTTDADPDRA